MRFSVVRRILKEDLNRDADKTPSWVDALLSPINEFLDAATIALRGHLTFKSNFASTVTIIDLTHDTFKEINPQRSGKLLGVLALNAENGQVIDGVASSQLNNGNIDVKVKFGSGSGTYKTTLVFLFDEE